MTLTPEILATRLRPYREASKLSDEGIARAADVSTSTVQRVLRGKQDPSICNIVNIATAIDCPIAYLLGVVVPDAVELRRSWPPVEVAARYVREPCGPEGRGRADDRGADGADHVYTQDVGGSSPSPPTTYGDEIGRRRNGDAFFPISP